MVCASGVPNRTQVSYIQQCICIMDPLKGPPPQNSSECWGEKGKLFFLLPRSVAIYRECGAGSDVFSVHAGTWIVHSIHEHTMYSTISMVILAFAPVPPR
jgi:hypothetical protein